MRLSIGSRVNLNNGIKMPVLGLGVYQMSSGGQTKTACLDALAAGYRLIDTASMYGNEMDVGAAVAECGLDREELFITTKVWNNDHGFDQALKAFQRSQKALGVDYVDLYLIHWPGGGARKETWQALEQLLREGKCRAIGVSNYTISHLKEMLGYAEVPPAVNQVEFHPWLFQKDLLEYCQKEKIQLEAYSPLSRARKLGSPILARIGSHYGKTPAQIMIRWGLQHGLVEIPKSTHKDRIVENANVFDFQISDSDIKEIDSIDRERRVSWDPSAIP
ncbi:MAG: aldo/keto reductase [Methanomassiliicoccales archaeon]|nr:aldo/keto reductase [Methanomassiliicoccales archaeon]